MPATAPAPGATARHVPDSERRARLSLRHSLAPAARVGGPESVARALVALHATEPASVHLSSWARTAALDVADVERAFYNDKSLVRQLCLRLTLFGLPRDLLPAVHGSICRRMAQRARADLARGAERAEVTMDGNAWVDRACDAVEAELSRGEPLSARQLRERLPEATGQFAQGAGTSWASTVQLTPRVITLLNLQGRITRCGNDGDWRTSRPLWTTTRLWLGADVVPLDAAAGYAELVRRWLWSYGPGTDEDIAWWIGTTKAAVRTALAEVGAVPVSLDGTSNVGWLLPDDLDSVSEPDAWVALLPVLDPSVMGWRERRFVLGGHAPALFDSVGNAGTTVWADGRVVGAWVQDNANRVRLTFLEKVPASHRSALDEQAERLTTWLDGQRVFSVYPSPAMREALT
jgi:hypothetical protein